MFQKDNSKILRTTQKSSGQLENSLIGAIFVELRISIIVRNNNRFQLFPASPKKPASFVQRVSYILILGMTYAYALYELFKGSKRSQPPLRSRETDVLGFRRQQHNIRSKNYISADTILVPALGIMYLNCPLAEASYCV